MRHHSPNAATVVMGDTAFRKLDDRSWNVDRRLEDMERDGVTLQVLSPMPELLSYWMEPADASIICDASNHQIAAMIAHAPKRFRGLGSVPMQDPRAAAAMLPRVRREFGLSGVEIGSNINGVLLGDASLDPFWEAAEREAMAVFVHALHPLGSKLVAAQPLITPFVLFPFDVATAAASIILAGVMERFPRLRIGFSHGGGALGSLLGRLDMGWQLTDGFDAATPTKPSEVAKRFFYDSNVYEPTFLRYLVGSVAPGRVFAGTDYPYEIQQKSPVDFIAALGLDAEAHAGVVVDAACAFLDEDLRSLAA